MLADLPREILRSILSRLDDLCARACLEATCTHLRDHLRNSDFDAVVVCYPGCNMRPSFLKFLEWLKRRAGRIRGLHVHGDDAVGVAMLGAAMGSRAARLVSLNVFDRTKVNAGVILPLAMIAGADAHDPPPIRQLSCSAGMGTPAVFNQLHKTLRFLHIGVIDSDQAHCVFDLHLPNLVSLSVSGTGQCLIKPQPRPDAAAAPLGFPALRHLILHQLHFTGPIAAFAAIANLESFVVDKCTGLECAAFPPIVVVQSASITSAAFPDFVFRGGLERLTVTGMPPGVPPLAFPVLKYLRATNVDLSGVCPILNFPALDMLVLGEGVRAPWPVVNRVPHVLTLADL